jgi:hypothetical protein
MCFSLATELYNHVVTYGSRDRNGCTVSVIMFSAAMNLIFKTMKCVVKISRRQWVKTGVRQPPVRAFMDHTTISTKTVIEGNGHSEI